MRKGNSFKEVYSVMTIYIEDTETDKVIKCGTIRGHYRGGPGMVEEEWPGAAYAKFSRESIWCFQGPDIIQ